MKYNYVNYFLVKATCKSPLFCGEFENSDDFIGGTSISGAFRSYISDKKLENELFGSNENQGKLIITDGFFTKINKVTRPRLRIDEKTGSSKIGGKFEVNHIETGSEFEFTITYLSEKDENNSICKVYDMLSALNSQQILFGSYKTNGYGQVNVDVFEKKYDLTDEKDREDWLSCKNKGKKIELNPINDDLNVVFTLKGNVSNILVKTDKSLSDDGKTYAQNIKENQKYIIPASSIKGAFRASASAIIKNEDKINEFFGCNEPQTAGKAYFEDAILKNSQENKITRIHINKFTGGVIEGALFNEIPVSGQIDFKIKVPNNDEICAVITYVLRDLGAKLISLGSGKTIGRGYIDDLVVGVKTPDQKTASIKFGNEIVLTDNDKIVENWLKNGGNLCK